jgi:NAD-dependent dihydropyrimidine dehydrogenase PreA subunit
MGLPYREELLDILRENLTPREAEVALLLPTRVAPMQPVGVAEIAQNAGLSREELVGILESLAERGLLFTGETREGEKGYALQQVGFGFPQTFFWKGEDTPHARHMAHLLAKYFNRQAVAEAYGSSDTKPLRFIPPSDAVDSTSEAVFPFHMMERVIEQAQVFAVAHCPCRMMMQLRDRGCDHPLEVCLKFDELAQYVIERGLAREITREEALEIIRESEEAGLVHFVDNAVGGIKHNCNCCGCACWSVGSIRRRKIPRDSLVATYFMRETDEEACIGCGDCVQICPVDCLSLEGDIPTVDEEWCIGCGVCVHQCSQGAAKLRLRADRTAQVPLPDFEALHQRIVMEKGLG